METYAFDKDGHPVDIEDPKAVRAEIQRDDGYREYVALGAPATFDVGEKVAAAVDAEAQPWDLTLGKEPITTLAQLRTYLGGLLLPEVRMRERIWTVMLLPQWANAPQSLKDDVDAYLSQ